MTLKNIVAALAAGIALALPSAAQAYEYNDGTYKWGFSIYENDNKEQVASLEKVRRVDGQKISGAITFPATVSLTVTNELGYSKLDDKTGKYNWVQTRAQKIETLTLPVEQIDWYYFGDYQSDPLITSVTIPEGVKYVVDLVDECLTNVTAVTFPSTVTNITSCFGYCDKLASVSVPEDAHIDSAFIGTPWAQSMGDFFIWNGNLIRYQGTASEVVVPEGVETLGTAAFAPYYWEGWTEESWEMFASATNITSVLLPSSLEEIGDDAFFGCEKLAAIDIPNGVYAIGDGAFEYTALTAITLPKSIRSLGGAAFAYTAISSLTIPEGVQYLLSTCAYMTNLTSVTIPSRAKYLYRTFNGCSKLASVDIPASVERIEYNTFFGCSKLAAVDIPASVERIEYNTFGGCAALTSVTGGAGLKYVDSDAFGDDPHWDYEKHEYVDGTGVPFYDNAPDDFRVLGPVAYGYKGKCPETLVVPAGVKYVMEGLTSDSDNSAVKTVTLSEGVETVGGSAFTCCNNLETVNLGNTVTNLGWDAFVGCHVLANVTGGAALQIGFDAFWGTPVMDNAAAESENDKPFELIRLANSKVVIGYRGKFSEGVFAIPDDVTEFRLDNSYGQSQANVTAIRGGAALIGAMYFGSSYKNVKSLDITGKPSYVDITLPAVETISIPNAKYYGLYECTNLVSAVLPATGRIPSNQFINCDKLASVKLVKSGYKLTGYEFTFTSGIKETFAGDSLQVFKYIDERTDFANSSWDYDWSGHQHFWIIPQFVKVLVDETALTPFDPSVNGNYAGLLYNEDGSLAGSFEATVKKASNTKPASVSVKIVPVNGKKETIKGTIDANGNGDGALAGLRFGANGITGKLKGVKNAATFSAEGATDVAKAKAKTPEADYLKALKDKAWGLVGYPLDGDAVSDFANGYAALSVLMQAKGKAKVAGVLPNGTKVSVSSKIVVGEDKCAIPVVFSKSKESFGFVFWVDKDGKALSVEGGDNRIVWVGKDDKRVPFAQRWSDDWDMGDALKPVVDPTVSISGSSLPKALTGVQTRFLPTYEPFTVTGTKWTFAKAPKIKFKKGAFDQAAFDKDIAAGKTNVSGMKLSVGKKNGLFKGSYTIYTIDEKGKLKKNKATVNGVMLEGIGFGSGLIKKIGAMPVEIGNPDYIAE